jgi:6-phosphogluconolactonase
LETLIKISPSPDELAREFADEIAILAQKSFLRKKNFTIALSGGSTPGILFSILGSGLYENTRWDYVHFFWGDERCVSPEDEESNFGIARKLFFDRIKIPAANIHRIRGENIPEREKKRYANEIQSVTHIRNGLPVFNLIILGLGGDGHTASIFPGNESLLTADSICAVAVHPSSGQKRITITGRVINNADSVVFLVTGSNKALVVADIIERHGIVDYPAAFIEPVHGTLKWYLDTDAASMLSQWA